MEGKKEGKKGDLEDAPPPPPPLGGEGEPQGGLPHRLPGQPDPHPLLQPRQVGGTEAPAAVLAAAAPVAAAEKGSQRVL